MLTIYKASAGSGKTFRLVAEYLKLILLNEFNYKHILAVTFTNKATTEMKARVISQLHNLSTDLGKSPYTRIISEETGLTQEEIKSRAKEALRNILHDFNRFSINTIDKFTQRVIKAFNREIGITPGYILELDNDVLLQEATDRLIIKSGTDKGLLKWLTELGNERLRDEKSFIIRDEIIKLGQELFKEKFQDYFIDGDKELYNRQNLQNYQKELQIIIHGFEAAMMEKGKRGLATLLENNLSVADFSFGATGVASVFKKVSEKQFSFGIRITDAAADPEKWVKKVQPRRDEILSLVERQLLPLLREILDYYETRFTNYITAKSILANLYTLGLLNDLQLEIDALRYEKGILPLSDSNLLLKKIIAGSDSPFIYEKTGNTYFYYMLDEFQDTSGMQWENFKPLIDNSLAEGKSSLAVGDVKQSIYRWRNSNWNILANEIETQFDQRQIQIFDLRQNWRSDSNIIGFNNLIFPELVAQVALKFDAEQETTGIQESEASLLFNKIYSDVGQLQGDQNAPQKGFAKINFIEETEEAGYKEQSLGKLLAQVKELQDFGFSGKDIAILVRRNSEGTDIIKHFLTAAEQLENRQYNLEIISNESLFLNSSNSVTFVVQLINHLVNPDDKITKANILNEYNIYLHPALQKKGKEIVYNSVNRQGQVAFNFPGKPEGKQNRQLDNLFEEEFKTIFAPVIQSLKTNILNASIDEAITYICNTFNLFELEEDLPFLQGLIDQAAQIKTYVSNDLSNFLKWWDEKGQKLSVNVNDDTDAIRLLTIHKSKGLEFKAVLIPFFDWQISWNFTPTIWCEPKQEPFNLLPIVPVKATKEMAQSLFRNEYFGELFNTYIDNLNLVYVAFTRAISVLVINAPYNEKENNKAAKVNQILYNSVSGLFGSGNWNGQYDESDNGYSYGELSLNTTEKKKGKEELILSEYFFNEFNSRLKLRTQSDDFFADPGLSDKNLGLLVHEILSETETANDINKACRHALSQQKINNDEYLILLNWLHELVESAEAKPWFSGEYKILNERNLLSVAGIKRPDRMMINEGKAVVVDYKLGQTEPEIYNRQVMDYATELKKIGFAEVTGYLWYLRTNKVEKVCRL